MGIVRKSSAHWMGDLSSGEGKIEFGSNAFTGPYSFKSRTADQSPQTNPEELIAAAHAGCFSMALSAMLTQAGHPPTQIDTTAKVHLDSSGGGFVISQIELETEGSVPGIDEKTFLEFAEKAKQNCPVSKALASVPITFKASFKE